MGKDLQEAQPVMITRRGFLKRAGGTLVALGVGIKSKDHAAVDSSGILNDAEVKFADSVPALNYLNEEIILTRDVVTGRFKKQNRSLSMRNLDNAGVDTKKLRSLFNGVDSDAVIAAKLIQTLDPGDFDSLAQYSKCVSSIAEVFGLQQCEAVTCDTRPRKSLWGEDTADHH